MIHTYRCWKCKRDVRVEQPARSKEKDLWCRNCANLGREVKLFRVERTHSIKTDATYFAGGDDGFGRNEIRRKLARENAKKAGVNTAGKKYIAQLAKYPGDPTAWVSDTHDVRSVCRQRGLGCPELGVEQPESDGPDPLEGPYKVADKIVDRELGKELAKTGPVSEQKKADMRESISERLAGVQD